MKNKNLIKFGLVLFIALAVVSLIFMVQATTQEELKLEKAQLEQELIDSGYDWLINYSGTVENVFFENYSCDNQTGYHTVKVLTSGTHTQLFEFGGENATAYNWAGIIGGGYINFTSPTPANGTVTTNTWFEVNVSIWNVTLDEVKYNWNGTNFTMYNDSLVLMMNFDNVSALGENDTLVKDLSGYGNNGTISGSVWNSTGKYGGAFEFDGVDDWINVSDSNSLDISEEISVGAWVKLENASQGNIEYKHGSYALSTNVHGWPQFSVWINNASYTVMDNVSLPVNEWHYLAGSYDGTSLNLYLDGVLRETRTESTYPGLGGSIDATSNPLISGGLESTCAGEMAYIDKIGGFCIDKYEASVWNADGTWNVTSNTSTWANGTWTDSALAASAYANSSSDKYPWVFIDQTEARTACGNHPSGNKYLCTDEQWLASADIKDQYFNLPAEIGDCTINESTDCDWADSPGGGDACMAGSKPDCVSSKGVYDMTGNVFEWTNATVDVINPLGDETPGSGSANYYYLNNTQGWQTTTGTETAKYGDDGVYFPTTTAGRAVPRGGHWSFGTIAGPFCAFLYFAPTDTSNSFGFRCCSSSSESGNLESGNLAKYHNSSQVYIGIDLPENDINGSIDELMIWNISLSADEIYQQYISNLNKYDIDKWGLYVNQSLNATDGLTDGSYTYQVFAEDTSGNLNWTDLRSLEVDVSSPAMNSSRIYSISNSTLDDLAGFCNATDPNSDAVNYYYEWYKDDALFSFGSLSNYTGSAEQVGWLSNSSSMNGAINVFVSGDYAYVTSYAGNSLTIIDVSTKTSPTQIGYLTNSSLGTAYGIYVSGDYAYVASYDSDSLTIIDVSTKTSPTQIGYLTNSSSMDGASSVYISGDYAYVGSEINDSLTVIDISTPSSPTQIGYLTNTTSMNTARDVHIVGDYAYVVSSDSYSLTIIDISTPSSPTQVASFVNTSSMNSARGEYVSGDYAYVTSYAGNSLTIIDVSTKTAPAQVGYLTNSSSMDAAYGIYVSGDYAYVGSVNNDSLTIIDVSTKSNPTQVGWLSNTSSMETPYNVYVSGDYAYVASYTSNSLTILDIADGFPAGLEINVNNISNNLLTKDDSWKLGCQAYDSSLYSSWVNSSTLSVLGIAGEDACGTISSSGTYTLTADVSSAGTCFTIGADDVVLDCNGFTINYSQSSYGHGVAASSKDNLTIKNCVIVYGGSATANNYGVYFEVIGNGTIYNNSITTGGTGNNNGIRISSTTSGNNVTGNTIKTSGTLGENYGIVLISSANNNTVSNNNITTSGGSNFNHGIYLYSTVSGNKITGNTIKTYGTDSNCGVYLRASANNNIVNNNNITANGSTTNNYGISIYTGSSNNISSNIVSTGGISVNYGIYIYSNSENNTITSNVINTSGSTTSHAFRLDASGSNYPENNNLTNNTLNNIAGLDLNFATASINGTYLIDQPIRNYSFTGYGGIVYFKNTTYGEIRYIEPINGSGSNLIGNASSEIVFGDNLAFVNSTSNEGLNVSANITLYGVGNRGYIEPAILKDSVVCTDCYNFTSLTAATVLFNVTGFTTYEIGDTPSACGTITSSTTLNQDVSSAGTCFTIGANNVVLDCAGYSVTYKTGGEIDKRGVDNTAGYDNVTVKNCNIVAGNSSSNTGVGIYYLGAINGLIENNTISTNGAQANHGIWLRFSSNKNVAENNTIYVSGTSSSNYGISIDQDCSNNNLTNNVIYTFGTASNYGITISTNSNNNLISSTSIFTNGTINQNRGVYIVGGSSNKIINSTIFTNGTSNDDGVFIQGDSDFNTIVNTSISTKGTDSHAFYFEASGSNFPENNNLTNNILTNIAGLDLNFATASINGTYLIDQPIRNYSFTGAGGIIYVKDSDYGEIRFLEAVNGTGTNLSDDIKINSNSIFVNTSRSSGLNRSANISLYGTPGSSFVNDIILRDGVECNSGTEPSCSALTSLDAATVIFNVSSFTNYSIGGDVAVDCGTITSSTTMNQDVSSSGTCFTIGADDVVLDCAGYMINYSQSETGYGVSDAGGWDNVTVKNCVIVQGGSATASNYGIYFSGVVNSTIDNNNITTLGGSSYAIYILANSDYNNITRNIIDSAYYGIYVKTSSSYNLLSKNNISSDDHGIRIDTSCMNNIVNFNSIVAAGSSSIGILLNVDINNSIIFANNITSDSNGIYIWGSSNNNVTSNNIITTGSNDFGIRCSSNSQYNIISDNNITTNNAYAFFFDGSSGYPENNNLTNNTLNSIAGLDLNFLDAGINHTYLIDQPIRSYSFAGAGGIVYFKNTTSGEIRYNEAINGSGTNLIGNASSDIIITNNSAFVNSTSNVGLNRSANITLYNIGDRGYSNTSILRNSNQKCDATTTPSCSNFTSLIASTVQFNVSSWTTYGVGDSAPNMEVVRVYSTSNTTADGIAGYCNST
ncbi:MAG: right-handed parallel beta-helix repeat-containing protein, partial [Nanoarchaeota archaeon]